ncbi:MAG TPA: NuoF family protein [Terriglobia bacterium]|nr:NuoF family protein [Terriglobia bacterium]
MSEDVLKAIIDKESEANEAVKHRIGVCTAAGCLSSGAAAVKESFNRAIKEAGLSESVRVFGTGCLGLCDAGPLVQVETREDGHVCACLYNSLTAELASQVVSQHLLKGEPVESLLCSEENPFFQQQQKVVLENSGKIDPERIEDYIAVGGYSALQKVVTEMTPQGVIREINISGLRGRGGGGYPTGLKWSTVAKSKGSRKYVICNADEGDPGAFMDRSVLEGDPHRVLEGMAVAAFAVGAEFGYIYVRGEYPLAISRLKTAIRQAERQQLLGNRIFDSEFNFRVDLRIGAGAFVCGEETALIASIEGKRGSPRPRPPYPAVKGLWSYPTLLNNVETYASVPPVILKGGNWYASIGTQKSKGTKVFALAGKIKNTGLIEVPMGVPLRKIIFEIGGGIPDGRKFKAAQTGGPSGGCIPAEHLDLPVDYESLSKVGSIMGSGGLIIMDETSCMVDVARFFMEFCMDESCGKCVPCRAGTVQMHGLLKKITEGSATTNDLAQLEQLCELLKHTSLCGLGQTAPNPVISTLRYFRDEYLAHIVEKRCPANVCKIRATPAATVEEVHA